MQSQFAFFIVFTGIGYAGRLVRHRISPMGRSENQQSPAISAYPNEGIGIFWAVLSRANASAAYGYHIGASSSYQYAAVTPSSLQGFDIVFCNLLAGFFKG